MSGMTAVRQFLLHHWTQVVSPLCVLAVTLALGYAGKRLLLRLLRGWAAHSRSQAPTMITNALAGPFMIWVLILGTHLATQSSDLPPGATKWVSKILLVLWILSLTIMASRLAGNLIRLRGIGIPGRSRSPRSRRRWRNSRSSSSASWCCSTDWASPSLPFSPPWG